METKATTRRLFFDIDGHRLCGVDFGGDGAPILLLHGLCGRASEWQSTATWLRERGHVVALDQRGHGMSARMPGDYGRDAFVADIVAVIERLNTGPMMLIGQSMGGLNALLAAAQRPDLVRGLVVAEATPERNPHAAANVRTWLASWPLPFPTLADARVFFGGETLTAATWSEVLHERPDGYWPQFDPADMVAAISDVTQRDYWAEWSAVHCPTLIVGAERGFFQPAAFEAMLRSNPLARFIQIPNAGHDLHLDQPQVWRAAVEAFLTEPRP